MAAYFFYLTFIFYSLNIIIYFFVYQIKCLKTCFHVNGTQIIVKTNKFDFQAKLPCRSSVLLCVFVFITIIVNFFPNYSFFDLFLVLYWKKNWLLLYKLNLNNLSRHIWRTRFFHIYFNEITLICICIYIFLM